VYFLLFYLCKWLSCSIFQALTIQFFSKLLKTFTLVHMYRKSNGRARIDTLKQIIQNFIDNPQEVVEIIQRFINILTEIPFVSHASGACVYYVFFNSFSTHTGVLFVPTLLCCILEAGDEN
jgi:hypothetical protein